MRRLTGLVIAFVAIVATLLLASSTLSAHASSTRFAPGDQLVYEITVELQQHHTTSGTKPRDTSSESAAHGTETFTVYAVASDGTALATANSDFSGTTLGTPFASHTTTSAKIMPDGGLHLKERLGVGISDALAFANTTTADLAQHPLKVGSSWATPQDSPYARATLLRKIVSITAYQGLHAYEIQSIGAGELRKTTDGAPASGTLAVSGTSYFDEQDRLLLGEAVRTLAVVLGPKNSHETYSSTMNIVLRSWTHGTPAPNATASGEATAPESDQSTGAETSPAPGAS